MSIAWVKKNFMDYGKIISHLEKRKRSTDDDSSPEFWTNIFKSAHY